MAKQHFLDLKKHQELMSNNDPKALSYSTTYRIILKALKDLSDE
jgi:hypothetical protein